MSTHVPEQHALSPPQEVLSLFGVQAADTHCSHIPQQKLLALVPQHVSELPQIKYPDANNTLIEFIVSLVLKVPFVLLSTFLPARTYLLTKLSDEFVFRTYY